MKYSEIIKGYGGVRKKELNLSQKPDLRVVLPQTARRLAREYDEPQAVSHPDLAQTIYPVLSTGGSWHPGVTSGRFVSLMRNGAMPIGIPQ